MLDKVRQEIGRHVRDKGGSDGRNQGPGTTGSFGGTGRHEPTAGFLKGTAKERHGGRWMDWSTTNESI